MAHSSNGKWAAGKSGNARGRPKKEQPKVLTTLADLQEVALRVANRPMTITIDDRKETMSTYEANMFGMATGSGQSRLARKAFVNHVDQAAFSQDLARKRAK